MIFKYLVGHEVRICLLMHNRLHFRSLGLLSKFGSVRGGGGARAQIHKFKNSFGRAMGIRIRANFMIACQAFTVILIL